MTYGPGIPALPSSVCNSLVMCAASRGLGPGSLHPGRPGRRRTPGSSSRPPAAPAPNGRTCSRVRRRGPRSGCPRRCRRGAAGAHRRRPGRPAPAGPVGHGRSRQPGRPRRRRRAVRARGPTPAAPSGSAARSSVPCRRGWMGRSARTCPAEPVFRLCHRRPDGGVRLGGSTSQRFPGLRRTPVNVAGTETAEWTSSRVPPVVRGPCSYPASSRPGRSAGRGGRVQGAPEGIACDGAVGQGPPREVADHDGAARSEDAPKVGQLPRLIIV